MKSINELRNEINDIDKEMAILFQKRMKLVSNIVNYKIKYSLPIDDSLRENEIIDNNLKNISNEEFKEYYLYFMKEVIEISKKYQYNKLKKKD